MSTLRGLEVIEHNSADLYGEGGWTHVPGTADGHAAPLPGYPAQEQLPQLPSPRKQALTDVALLVAVGAACFALGLFL